MIYRRQATIQEEELGYKPKAISPEPLPSF